MSLVTDRPSVHRVLAIGMGDVSLEAELLLPAMAEGVVLLCHGADTPARERAAIASTILSGRRLGTLRVCLSDASRRPILAALDWMKGAVDLRGLPLGIFSTSPLSGAALGAAAERPYDVGAVVVSGSDLGDADGFLAQVRSPTLLIADARDHAAVGRCTEQLTRIRARAHLAIAPHAPDESAAAQLVAAHAAEWFHEHAALDSSA